MFWKNTFFAGILSGVVWGLISLVVNHITGAFEFEAGFAALVMSFTFAGAVFGVVVAGLMQLLEGKLPFKNPMPNAVMVSTGLWFIFRVAGVFLSTMEPERYHVITLETFQGLILSIVLGILTAVFFRAADRQTA